MKNLYFILFALFTISSFSQETFYKNYKIRNFIDFLNDGKNTYDYNDNSRSDYEKSKVKFLSKEECVSYNSLSTIEKGKIDARLKLVKDGILTEIKFKDCSGNEFVINKSNVDISEAKELIGVTMTVRAKTFGNDQDNSKIYKAGLLMEGNKLYVNLWPFKEKPSTPITSDGQDTNGLSKHVSNDKPNNKNTPDNKLKFKEYKSENDDKETRKELFYEIPDDHTAVFNFTEINVNAITIPLKYRFRSDRSVLMTNDMGETEQVNVDSEEFSTSFNIALFGGYSWGKTKFTHRKKIGNKVKTNKNTLGVFFGSDAITLSSGNTNVIPNQEQNDREGTIGTISFGIGFVKSWNKITFGVFSGIDKGVGRVSENWIYDGRPWLGIGLGYDLFKL